MLRRHQSCVQSQSRVGIGWLWRGFIVGGVVALGACSADIDSLNPKYGLANGAPVPQEPIGRRNAGAPPAYDNSGWGDSGPRTGAPRADTQFDRPGSLPEASAPIANPSHPFDAPRKPKPAAAVARANTPVAVGATIEVQQGDSLYAISKRYKVSIASLMEANGLRNANLKPGQKIVLPSTARRPAVRSASLTPPTEQPAAVPAMPPPVATLPPRAAVATPPAEGAKPAEAPAAARPEMAGSSGWEGSYTVKPGDSLYGIARRHKTTVAELQRNNGITDALKMKPGMALKVPASAEATVPAAPAAGAPAIGGAAPPVGVHLGGTPAEPSVTSPPTAAPARATGMSPAVISGPTAAPAAVTPASTGAPATFMWPAKGPLLAGFGKRPDGAHNDGINIGVPAGTDIKAAEAGTVAYAGGEIKAYGNLVLIRHEGGWVTAYAHADQLLVKRGDTIKRGQVIAKAGTTGSVDQAQVHFELRQGSKPIDPAPHMEK